MNRTITAWETSSNGSISLGKKTSANLELLREDLQDKLNDVNETWQEMEGNNDGNKTTRSALSRAVRRVARSTTSAFCQIEELPSEWQANVDRGKRSTEWKKSIPIPVLPSRKSSYQADTAKIRPIPEPR